MNDTFKQFVNVIEELIQLFRHLIEVEQNKVDVVRKNQVTALEECMNQEQAAVLKLRGLDQKREQLMESMGYKGLTFRQILEKAPSNESEILTPLFKELDQNITLFKEISESGKTALQSSLHKVEVLLKNRPEKTFSNKLV